jgi:hypothetical protein
MESTIFCDSILPWTDSTPDRFCADAIAGEGISPERV